MSITITSLNVQRSNQFCLRVCLSLWYSHECQESESNESQQPTHELFPLPALKPVLFSALCSNR